MSKLPYLIPVNYYDGKTTYTALSVQAFRPNQVGYRCVYGYFKVCVYGYFKVPVPKQAIYNHAYQRDNTIPIPKYK